MSENFSKQVDKVTFDFIIWDNKTYKIKKNTLFDSMNKAFKVLWMRRFNTDVDASWKIILNYLTGYPGSFRFLLSCNYKSKELELRNIPSFYTEILNIWEMIKKINLETDQDRMDQFDVII